MERNQHPALSHAFDVTVESPQGHWPGKTIDLSPSGAKVRLAGDSGSLLLLTVVQLRIALPDGAPSLSLPARVIETDSDGVILSFFNLKDQAQRHLKDLLDSFVPDESQVLLHESGSNGSERHVSTQSSMPPGFLEDTPQAEGATPHGAGQEKPEAVLELQPAEPVERSVPPIDVRVEEARLQALLGQAGLDGLSLPSNGVLSSQWRKFLEQLGTKASPTSTGTRPNRPARAEGSNVAKGRGNRPRPSR
jgi:hypothetical protein